MDGTKRRDQILSYLSNATSPVNGTELAQLFSISRQVIVQDIAILRAENHPILSTNKGYLMQKTPYVHHRTFCVKHGYDEMEDELNAIVDYGGCVRNTTIEHEVYGQITVEMYLKSRHDVKEFLDLFQSTKALPLTSLTGGVHFHTVTADSQEELSQIEKALIELGVYVDLNKK